MHEFAISQCLLNLTLARAEAAGAIRVTAVHVALGELTGLVPDCIDMYWNELSQGTAAEGSAIHYRAIPALLQCGECEALTPFDTGQHFGCECCGSQELKLQSGDEINLEALDAVWGESESEEIAVG